MGGECFDKFIDSLDIVAESETTLLIKKHHDEIISHLKAGTSKCTHSEANASGWIITITDSCSTYHLTRDTWFNFKERSPLSIHLDVSIFAWLLQEAKVFLFLS